jgi:tetratricopeptide (TPR) repeat protein
VKVREKRGVCRSLGRALCLFAVLLACSREALAQSEPVVRALLNLHSTLEGRYGDEGVEVSRRFEDLSRALAGWDRSIPAEPIGDFQDPITAYQALTRPGASDMDRLRARAGLRLMARDVIRGRRTQPPSRFPPPPGLVDESGGAPRFPLARYAAVFASSLRGEVDQATVRMKEAAATDPLIIDPASRSDGMQKAAASLRLGSVRDAIGALEAVVKAFPASSEAHRLLATATGLAGDSRRSVEQFAAALKIHPDDERSWIALGNLHIEAGALTDAARALEKAIAAIPDSGRLRWMFAGVLVRLDRVGEALVHYTEAERLAPLSGRAAVHQAVAGAATLQQDVERAAAASEQRTRANPNDSAAHRDLASMYQKQGRQADAFAELAIAAWLDSNDQLTLSALGQSFMADGEDEDAVAAFERAVMLQPDLREARYGLAQALTRTSRREEAQRQLAEFERQRAEAAARERRALEIDSIKGEARRRSAAGQHAQAVTLWKKVLGMEPNRAQNYLELAEALVKAGSLEESLQYFVKTADLDGVAEVHLRLAEVLARLGRTRESGMARETYEKLRLEDFRRAPR